MTQLTSQACFRLGFLLRCAEEGCDMDEVQGRVKFAADKLAFDPVDSAVDLIKSVAPPAWGVAKTMVTAPIHAALLGIGGAGVVGAGAGYGLAKLQNNDVDADEAKQQELITAYRLQADLARRRAQQRSYRRGVPAFPRFS